MYKDRSQLINTVLIVLGGLLLVFQISGEESNPYILIAGLVLLMFGLYRATNHWVYTKDDHKKDDAEKGEGEDENNRLL